ncbi:hypothetical protein [Streptomyces sp. 900105755]
MGEDQASAEQRDRLETDRIRSLREAGDTTPVFVYGGSGAMARRDQVAAAGGDGVTQTSSELFALLGEVGRFPSTAT